MFLRNQTEQATVEQSLASMGITTSYPLLSCPSTLLNACINKMNEQNPLQLTNSSGIMVSHVQNKVESSEMNLS